jgi:Leucine-rich repeat (LRR) protein
MSAQGGGWRRSKAKWLELARRASGIKDLEANRLTIEDGLLTRLYLCDNQLTSVPQSIGQLTALTELDLRSTLCRRASGSSRR